MNLFYLNLDPEQCAKEHCDKHVVKMTLEIVQMLYTAHHLSSTQPEFAYKKSHVKHPISIWIRSSIKNYTYAVTLAKFLAKEYTYRYQKIHSCEKHIDWLIVNFPNFENNEILPFPLSMPDECKLNCPIKSYQNYYILKKRHFAKWTNRPIPRWFTFINLRKYFLKG